MAICHVTQSTPAPLPDPTTPSDRVDSLSSCLLSPTCNPPTTKPTQTWGLSDINPKVIQAEYAVRGKLAIRAEELQKQLLENPDSLPFSHIIYTNIGNPQQLGQPPITFLRQLSALLEYPTLLKPENEQTVLQLFPKDAIRRAKTLLKEIKSVGAYTHSQGIISIRQHVADFIEARDCIPSDPSHIFLTNGASAGILMVLQVLLSDPKDGVLIPVPQYPIYMASLTLCGAEAVPYYLDESNDWQIDLSQLYVPSKTRVKAICVINPGNPTGTVLTRKTMESLLMLAEKHQWVVIADEVYQTNVYQGSFLSFKRLAAEMNVSCPVISFHSVSKGIFGECGRRGGYFECFNVSDDLIAQFYKLASIGLCPAVQGQVAVDVMVHPPMAGDASYDLYQIESQSVHASLKAKAKKLQTALNKLEGVHCTTSQGALYLFPRFEFPPQFHLASAAEHMPSDTFYALKLLESTGICMVPGSGFLQVPGTFHLRTTFLPQTEEMDLLISRLTEFHEGIMRTYKGSA